MQLIEYYHHLNNRLPKEATEHSITLTELAGILYCSERNVKLLLKKMSELEWIIWEPGRGRGNRSRLTLRIASDRLLADEAKRYVLEGNMKGAMDLIGQPGLQNMVKEQFFTWLSSYFGYMEIGEREKRLDTLRLPYYSPILTLDPSDMLYAKDLHLVRQIFDTLVRFDPLEKRFKPHLAHYWETAEKGTVWTFYLRKGVKFHHGRELTADDAVFTMERLKELGRSVTNGWLAEHILRARAVSAYVLQVELTRTNYMFLHYVSAAGLSVLPRDIYAHSQGHLKLPVGTGPFRVSARDECVCVLDAFADYFLERALLDRVELWMMPMDYRPVMGQGSLEPVTAWRGDQATVECPDYKIMTKLEQGCSFLVFNMKQQGPHQSRRFREAVHLLVDRNAMAREIDGGDTYPARGFLPQEPPQWEESGYDPVAARILLREDGYQGEPLHIMLSEKHVMRGNWIAARLAKEGIPVNLEILTWEEAGSLGKAPWSQCYLGGTVVDEDMDLSLLEMYQIENMPLRLYFSDELQEELDLRINAILEEPEQEKRPMRIRELENTLKDNCYVLFLLHSTSKTTFSSVINGVSLNSLGLINFKELWFQPSIEK